MLRPALALLLLLVLLPASAHAADDAPPGADPAPAPAVTRASMTWDQPVDIDLHIYDGEGHHAWYADRDDIPDAVLTHDNVSGFEADTTTEDLT